MNREELAKLLAQTHPRISHSSPSCHPPDPIPRSPTAARLRDSASPLSPRQVFQSRVRTLSDDGTHQTGPPTSATRKNRELGHFSSLQVHVRSTTPTSPGRRKGRKHGYSSRDGRFMLTPADPDFVVEERAAWNAESPEKRRQVSNPTGTAQGDDHGVAYTLKTEDPEASSPSRPSLDNVALMRFGPSSTATDIYDRPRTSRGPRQGAGGIPGAFPEPDSRCAVGANRRSKFNEGSMNERSTALSSTWDEYGSRLSESSDRSAEDADSDATPRATRMSRDSSSSFDVSEFKPTSATPSAIKNKISRLGSHFKSSEEAEKLEQKKDKHKGLRKSISNWNFHSIGEKMRFFGSSTQDPGDQNAAGPIKKQKNVEVDLLNNRKRKAGQAYAQQFGTKKQKSNDGIPVADKSQSTRTPPQSRTLKKRSASAQRTLTPATVRRRRETSPQGACQPVDTAEIMSDGDVDRRKRPTRRELEKENQHLRAMLREQQQQQSASLVRSASKSTVHLPLEDQHGSLAPNYPNTAVMGPRQINAGVAVNSQQKRHHTRSQGGIPPVPALPTRAVLANLGAGNVANGRNDGPGTDAKNRQRDSHFGAAETGTIKRVGGGVPRPVSTVLEGDENMPTGESKNISTLELGMLSGLRASPRKDHWQWPDDVF